MCIGMVARKPSEKHAEVMRAPSDEGGEEGETLKAQTDIKKVVKWAAVNGWSGRGGEERGAYVGSRSEL